MSKIIRANISTEELSQMDFVSNAIIDVILATINKSEGLKLYGEQKSNTFGVKDGMKMKQ